MPNLKEKLGEEVKLSLRQGEKLKCSVLRMLVSAISYAEIAKQKTFTDEEIFGVIAKEIKQRRESIEAYKQANRPELVEKEQQEMEILQSYMPEQMGEAELTLIIKKVISETGASTPQDKGKVMGKLMPLVKGKADGQMVNNLVTALLNN
ncbi:MAG: GatB/YqeY domain-containing protein [Dehalococcoides mccartyi]|uniref:Aspartyl-tRNA amidotransferase n=1 Tax=Dehalococcoides mccartyi TaxID=61435 RepID=A0A0V8M531_9CHLR|nr:GatB/YqeY domain-containing protein [Dehalococcoides mccartyi]KSV18832.1 aspartyl-tRNA amidotransferase [Dehalococcoides mccartyi]MDN4186057.1 GatB/YqeY domain-containing protein [Dehalococcoides mccartyi]